MKSVRIKPTLLWFAILGVIIHIAFLLLLGPLQTADLRRQQESVWIHPDYGIVEPIPLIALSLPCCVYCPAIFLAIVVNGLMILGQDQSRFRQVFGIVLGILTGVYALFWVIVYLVS